MRIASALLLGLSVLATGCSSRPAAVRGFEGKNLRAKLIEGDSTVQAAVFDGVRFLGFTSDGHLMRRNEKGRWASQQLLPDGESVQAVAHGNGLTVVFGGGRIARSPDTFDWKQTGSLLPVPIDVDQVKVTTMEGVPLQVEKSSQSLLTPRVATFGNGKFVAATLALTDTVFVTSTDGITWEQHLAPMIMNLTDLTAGDPGFAAVGSSTILCSPDGTDWTAINHLQPDVIFSNLLTVAYGNGQYFAAGSDQRGKEPVLLHSTDCLSWERVEGHHPAFKTIRFVTERKRFYALTTDGSIVESKDGLTWDHLARITGHQPQTLTYGAGMLVVFTDGAIYEVSLPDAGT